jgi:hypothetical protein
VVYCDYFANAIFGELWAVADMVFMAFRTQNCDFYDKITTILCDFPFFGVVTCDYMIP